MTDTLKTLVQDTTLATGRKIVHVDLECEVGLTEGNFSNDPAWAADPEAWVEGKVKVTDGQEFTAEEMAEIQAIVEAEVAADPEHVAFTLGLCE
tara:strand:+ start:276 stop:557 length:282 start_codon:yes stop_codon:yes gene_type:complete